MSATALRTAACICLTKPDCDNTFWYLYSLLRPCPAERPALGRLCLQFHKHSPCKLQPVCICSLTWPEPAGLQCNSHTFTPLVMFTALPMAMTPRKKGTITSCYVSPTRSSASTVRMVSALRSFKEVCRIVLQQAFKCCSWAGGDLQHNVTQATIMAHCTAVYSSTYA